MTTTARRRARPHDPRPRPPPTGHAIPLTRIVGVELRKCSTPGPGSGCSPASVSPPCSPPACVILFAAGRRAHLQHVHRWPSASR